MLRSAMLSAFVLFAGSAGLRADDDAKTILEKAVKAHGGAEFLDKHPAARSQNKGKLQVQGMDIDFTQEVSYMLPGKFRESMELSIGGQTIKILTIANGDKISITAMDKEVPVTDEIKKAIKEAQEMFGMIRLTKIIGNKDYELSLFGDAKVDEKPAVGVRISGKGKKDVTMFFDKKTNLLVKIEHRPTDAQTGNEVTEERIITEYQKGKDGVQVPKKVVVKRDGKTFLEAEVAEVTFLEKIDDAEFKK